MGVLFFLIMEKERSKKYIVLVSFFSLLMGFFLTFPLRENLEALLIKRINSLPSCPVGFDSLRVSFFLPKIELENPTFTGPCNRRKVFLPNLPMVRIYFRGLSFSPLGIKLKITTEGEDLQLKAYTSLGVSAQKIKLENLRLPLSVLGGVAGRDLPLQGVLMVDAILSLDKNALQSLKLRITSGPLVSPLFQDVSLGSLVFKVEKLDKVPEINILEARLGSKASDFYAEVSGEVSLNEKRPESSKANLLAKIKLGEKLKDNFLLKAFLGRAKEKDGLYELPLKGPLNALN